MDWGTLAIVVYAAGLDEAAARRTSAELEAVSAQEVTLHVVPQLPTDAEALAAARDAHAEAVLTLQSDAAMGHLQLRAAQVDTSQWKSHALDFDAASDRAAREHSTASAAASMLPARTVEEPPPRWHFGAGYTLSLSEPILHGMVVRPRVRLFAGAWLHVAGGLRMGSAPVDGGVREVPLEIGLAYHLPIGSRVQLGVRAEVMALSRRMAVPKVTPSSYHRWLFGVRGGGELLVRVVEQFGFALFVGVEANLGATDVVLPTGTSSFSPVRAYGELGPYLRF